jgi:hypothetical protein
MPAPLTATTDLAGSLADYSLAPARGMAGDADGAGAVGDTAMAMAAGGAVATVGASTVDAATTADADSPVAVGSLADEATRVVRQAGFMAAEVGSTVAAASMAEEADSTVVVADTAAAAIAKSSVGSDRWFSDPLVLSLAR